MILILKAVDQDQRNSAKGKKNTMRNGKLWVLENTNNLR